MRMTDPDAAGRRGEPPVTAPNWWGVWNALGEGLVHYVI